MNAWCIVNNPSFLEYMAGSQNSDFPKIINGTVPPPNSRPGFNSVSWTDIYFHEMKCFTTILLWYCYIITREIPFFHGNLGDFHEMNFPIRTQP